MRRTIFCVLAVLAFFACPLFSDAGENNPAAGIYMNVSGKVIQKETGKGVPGVKIDFFETYVGESFNFITDKDGNFMIRMVPQGIYEISEVDIHLTCPEELIIDEIPGPIKVTTGKNIFNLNIYLKRGATISGCVYDADGIMPLKDVEMVSDPWIYGKSEAVYTNEQGKYIIKGVGEGYKLIYASNEGFGLESNGLDIMAGENFENVDFILGKGNISVKGKVVSAQDNQVVKNSLIFFTYMESNKYYSAGFTRTDNNGEYCIIGLKYPGSFELSIVHDEFDESDSYITLNKGENILDLRLESKRTTRMSQSSNKDIISAQNNSNTQDCECDPNYNHDYNEIQNNMCELLNGKPDCIGDSIVLDCLKNRCDKRNYTITCDPDCPPNVGARVNTVYLNISSNKHAEIRLCTNNGIQTKYEIMGSILHELFHTCDRGARTDRTSCSEWRDHRAMYCTFGNPRAKIWKNRYKQMCKECLFKGINCK